MGNPSRPAERVLLDDLPRWEGSPLLFPFRFLNPLSLSKEFRCPPSLMERERRSLLP